MNILKTIRSAPTIGREAEKATIVEAIDSMSRGAGSALFLIGEAGQGKTRLLRDTAGVVSGRGLPVFIAGAVAAGPPAAFGQLAQALRSWIRTHGLPRPELAPFRAGLRFLLPELEPASGPSDMSPDQIRMLILEGALQLLLGAGGRNGAVLLLDDLQDADPETLQFVHYAAEAAAGQRLLVVATVRLPEGQDVEAGLRVLNQRGLARIMEIGPLARSDVSRLLESYLAAEPPGALVDDFVRWTDGVPLLVEALVEANSAAGTLRVEAGSLSWTGGVRAIVPRTIAEVVRQKMARLTPDARRVVAALALVRTWDPESLARASALKPSAIPACVAAAVDAGILVQSEGNVRFRHQLLREAVAQGLLPGESDAIHRRTAEAIDAAVADRDWLEEKARHLVALGRDDEAASLMTRVGLQDLRSHGPLSAERDLREAVALARSEETRSIALDAMSRVLGVLGRWSEAYDIDRELVDRAGETHEHLARGARNAIMAGRAVEAAAWVDRAAALGADPARLRALTALGSLWRGDLATAIGAGNDALEAAARSGDSEAMCSALDVIGRANDALGSRQEARAAFVKWERVASSAGLTMSRTQAMMELGNLDFLSTGSPAGLRAARKLASECGALTTLVLADLSLAWCEGACGELAEARECAEEAVDLARRLRLDLLPHALGALGWLTGMQDQAAGRSLIEEALIMAPDDTDARLGSLEVRTEWALRARDFEKAAALGAEATEGLRLAPASAAPNAAPVYWVWALGALGRRDEARIAAADLRAGRRLDRHYVLEPLLAGAEALCDRSLDRFNAAMNDDRMRRTGYFRAVFMAIGGEVLGRQAVAGCLLPAMEALDSLRIEPDASHVRRAFRDLGIAPPRRRQPQPSAMPESLARYSLTPRQVEILREVEQGRTNADIAASLVLSVRTVESHVAALYAKFGVTNRAALLARLHQNSVG